MDDNFYEKFKENLENRPEPSFDSKLWQRVKKDLDKEEGKKKNPIIWWAAATFLLFSMGTNFWFLQKFHETKERIDRLISETDTIYQTKIIYQIDTVYTASSKAPATKTFRQIPKLSFSSFSNRKFVEESSLFNAVKSSFFIDDLTQSKSILGRFKQIEIEIPETINSKALSILPAVEPALLTLQDDIAESLKTNIVLQNKKKTWVQRVYSMRPKDFNFGIEGGLALPAGSSLSKAEGFTLGTNAQLEFSPQLRMWISAAYNDITYESSEMGESIGIPVVNSPSDDFEFDVADLEQSAFEYSVGMQYLWRPNKKLRPYLGLGYGTIALRPYTITYDFKNEATGFEWSFEERINQRELITDFLFIQAGLEYEINKDWFWKLKTGYRTNLKNSGITSPRLLNISAGIGYQF